MELTLIVTLPDDKPVDLSVDLGEWSSEQVQDVFAFCEGPGPIAELARGEWNPLAARALVYVKVRDELAAHGMQLEWGDMVFDVGELEPYLRDAELIDIESTLPMTTEGG